ncbi:MAG: hypothetical protein KTR20_02305 [Cellvibrionaceae bacterium]|nr:hypothetical protein [Cellvibrionaceae bacterium]
MSIECCFESLEVQNRLGQVMVLRVCPLPVDENEICLVVAVPPDRHQASFAKSAEHIAFQLYERFSRAECRFSLIELRDLAGERGCYRWCFTWVGSTPIEGRYCQLSRQEQQRYLTLISGVQWAAPVT